VASWGAHFRKFRQGYLRAPQPAEALALRSRGVPRIANRLLRRVRDVTDDPKPAQVKKTLAELGVDSWGMDDGDRRLLMLLFDRFDGGPVGVRTLAAAAGHEERTLLEAFEPYWLRRGLIDVTERGRRLTTQGFVYCQWLAGARFGTPAKFVAPPVRDIA